MKRFAYTSLVLVALLAAPGCGEDEAPTEANASEPVTPPENPERELPTAGAPQDDDHEAPPPPDDYVREDRVTNSETDGECCVVEFAYAPPRPQEVEAARLRGNLFPLDTADGVLLQESDGIWSGEACLGLEQPGTYHYELSLQTVGSDQTFLSNAHNRYAPTTTEAGELVNLWVPADDCASIDLGVHAQTSD